jgi:hypothetical protein
MGWLLIDRVHGAAHVARATATLVYVVTVPAGVQAIVALVRRRRSGRR